MSKLFLKIILVLLIVQLSDNVYAMQQTEFLRGELSTQNFEYILLRKVTIVCNDLENIHQDVQSLFNKVCNVLKNFATELSAEVNNHQSMQLLEALKTQKIIQSIFARYLNFVSEDNAKKAILEAVSQKDEWKFFFAVCLPKNNPNAVYTTKYKATQLHFAAGCGFAYALTALLVAGARVNEVDAFKLTPLHCASIKQFYRCMDLLIDAGANQEAQDIWGRKPFACYGVELEQILHI